MTHGGRVDTADSGAYVRQASCAGCSCESAATKFNGSAVLLCWSCEREEWVAIARNESNTKIFRDFAKNNVRRMDKGLSPKVSR